MPTTRQRFQITQTDELPACLDQVELTWPQEARSKLLVRWTLAGAQSTLESPAEKAHGLGLEVVPA